MEWLPGAGARSKRLSLPNLSAIIAGCRRQSSGCALKRYLRFGSSHEVPAIYRSAKTTSGVPVDGFSFSDRRHLGLVRWRPRSMAATVSGADARADNVLTEFESTN